MNIELIEACNFLIQLARDGLFQMPDDEIDPIRYNKAMDTLDDFLRSKGVDTYNLHKIYEEA